MPSRSPDETFTNLNDVLAVHKEWLAQMPWGGVGDFEASSIRDAVDGWIDEFTEQFQSDGVSLSRGIDLPTCWQRIFNLLSGPCLAFIRRAESRSAGYQNVAAVLRRHNNNVPLAGGLSEVRDSFRTFGPNDGIRHCVLASAVQAGHESAIGVFREEFDGVRRQLTASFASQMSEDAVDEVWQDVFTDLVFGGVGRT